MLRRAWAARERVGNTALKCAAFIAGVVILFHEVWLADTAEPLLIFLGLWLCGIPPAMFFDGLRKLGQRTRSELEDATVGGAPKGKAE